MARGFVAASGIQDRRMPVFIKTHAHDIKAIRHNIDQLIKGLNDARAQLDDSRLDHEQRVVLADFKLMQAQTDLAGMKPKKHRGTNLRG